VAMALTGCTSVGDVDAGVIDQATC